MDNITTAASHDSDRIEAVGWQSTLTIPRISDTSLARAVQDLATTFGFRIERPGRKRLCEYRTDTPLERGIVEDVLDFYDAVDPLYRGHDVRSELRIGETWKRRLERSRGKQLDYIANADAAGYHALLDEMFIGPDQSELLADTVKTAFRSRGVGRMTNTVSYPVVERVRIFERVTGCSREALVTNTDWSLWGMQTETGVINGFEPEHGLHAWQLLTLLDTNSVGDNPGIVELGGGIGSVAEKFTAWAERPFTIFLVDLPLNLTTAYAYLARIMGRDRVELIASSAELEQLVVSDEKQVILLPTIFVETLTNEFSYDVVHNSASLSEMEFDIIEWYLHTLLDGTPEYFLETNTNVPKTEIETLSRRFPIPERYDLLGRFEANEKGGKYCTSLYAKS